MKDSTTAPDVKNFSWAGVLMTLGIVFGNLATSPLYTMKAIISAVIAREIGRITCHNKIYHNSY